MKKNKLSGNFEIDFDLYGLVSNAREYKLAWHLNNEFEITLSKQEDIRIEFSDRSSILISQYLYETEHLKIELLQNKLVAQGSGKNKHLIPELSQFDYLLKYRDSTGETHSENIILRIKELSLVEFVVRLNFGDLKSKENLLY